MNRQRLPILAFLTCAIFILVFRWPILTDPNKLGGGDVNRGIYWMQKWRDGGLFANDPISDYLASIQPVGMKAVYRAAALFANPVDVSRWLPIPLFFITVILLYLLARRFEGPVAGTVAVLVFLGYEGSAHLFSSGTASDFMPPLFLGILYGVGSRSLKVLAVLFILAVLFYPSTFLIGALAALVWLGVSGFKESGRAAALRNALHLGICIAPAFVLLFLTRILFGGTWGETVSKSEMANYPQFLPGGIEPFVELSFKEWIAGPRSGFALEPVWMALVLGMVFSAIVCTRIFSKGSALVVCFALCSVFWFAAAHLVAVRIGFPTNYVRFTLPLCIVLCIGIAVGASKLLETEGGGLHPQAFGAAVVLIALIFLPFWDKGYEDYNEVAPLNEFLSTLPPSALIAGRPDLLESAPALTARRVFFARQADGGFHKKYLNLIQSRKAAFHRSYFAEDRERYCDAALRNGFDYMVADRKDFESADPSNRSYLMTLPDDQILFRDGSLFVSKVDCAH